MALGINGYNDAFKAFVDFATVGDGAHSDKAVARAPGDVAGGSLAGRRIVAASSDSVRGFFKWFRSSADKRANNATRDAFKNAVVEMFGRESNIPDFVKKAMLMADYDKGKPLTSRRIIAVKNALDVVAGDVAKSLETAKANADDAVRERVGDDAMAAVNQLVEEAIGRCYGDKDALEVISKSIGQFLIGGDNKLRTVEQIRQKADAIVANVKEMREAAKGDRAALAACKGCLVQLGGKSLPKGILAKVIRMVATADTSKITRIKSGSSGESIDTAVRAQIRLTYKVMSETGAEAALVGADEKEALRTLIAGLVVAKGGTSGARRMQQALSSENAEKLMSIYGLLRSGSFDKNGMSAGHISYTRIQGSVAIKFLTAMKLMSDVALGEEGDAPSAYDGEFDLADFDAWTIFEHEKEDAKALMESQRKEAVAKYVKGNGPGADEIRTLFEGVLGAEPDDGRASFIKGERESVFTNTVNWTIAADCKKFNAGDFSSFVGDLERDLNVTLPDGSKLDHDFNVARDQIASFVTGGATKRYDDLDATGKGKASVVMSLITQSTMKLSYESHAISLDPKLNTPQYVTASDQENDKKEFKISFAADGSLYVEFYGEQQAQMLTVSTMKMNSAGKAVPSGKTVQTNPGSTIGTGFTLKISAAEFERLAKLDYSKFDDSEANQIIMDDSGRNKFGRAVNSFDKQFRLNTDDIKVYMKFSANFT